MLELWVGNRFYLVLDIHVCYTLHVHGTVRVAVYITYYILYHPVQVVRYLYINIHTITFSVCVCVCVCVRVHVCMGVCVRLWVMGVRGRYLPTDSIM